MRVCAWMSSRKLTEGVSLASSSLTTSHSAIWHPFPHDGDLLSICSLVYLSVCERVTLLVFALKPAANLQHYTCKQSFPVIY